MSKNLKQIIVTDIEWDAPEEANLPNRVTININKDNEYLLEDIEDCADNLSDFLSDEYGYCHYGFKAEIKGNF